MTECPACGKAVDTLRARNVTVIAGRVVAFCSPECVARGEQPRIEVTATAASASRKDQTPVPKRGKSDDKTPVPKKMRTPPAGVAAVADLDSGPVIEIIHEPASGVVTSAPDARTGLTKASDFAEASGDIQISETEEPAARRSGRRWLVVAIVAVLGGGAVAAYELGYLGADRASHAATARSTGSPAAHAAASPAPAPAPAPKPAPPKIDYVGAARDVLHAELASKDRHLARLAAEALARTGASEAMVALIDDLHTEQSITAKLEIEYVLARGEDRRGTDGLVAALTTAVDYDHPDANRLTAHDDRLDAASRLAKLGDKRAVPVLAHYLDAPEQRLGAAAALAYLAEPRAIDALGAIRKDAAANAADKASAAIALAIAGKADVAPALRALLADPHFNADAAGALAELHDGDPAVKRVLMDQLKFPSLCVGAARALRRLDPGVEAHDQLEALLTAARAAKGPDRIADAEAVLLLAGSPEWSEHP